MFAAALGAYAAGWLLIAVPLRRFTSLQTQGLTVAVAAFVAAPFLFSIVGSQASTDGTVFLGPLVFGLALSCLALVVAYLAWEGLARFPRGPNFVLRIGFSMPFVLAALFAFQWLIREVVGVQRSWGFFLLLALYWAVCAVTIRFFTRPSHDQKVFGGLLSLSAALCLSLAGSFTIENLSTPSLPPASERAHRDPSCHSVDRRHTSPRRTLLLRGQNGNAKHRSSCQRWDSLGERLCARPLDPCPHWRQFCSEYRLGYTGLRASGMRSRRGCRVWQRFLKGTVTRRPQ